MEDTRSDHSSRRWPLAGAAGLFVAIFILDLVSPLGRAVPLLYIIPMLAGLSDSRARVILLAAAVGSILALVKYWLAVDGLLSIPVVEAERSLGLLNRLMFIGTIWAAAFGLWRYVAAERRARDAETLILEKRAMVQLGEMATVIAHEIRNPLAGMGGALQIIARRLPPEHRDRPILKEILDRLESLSASLNHLLRYARPRQPSKAPVDVLDVLHASARALKQDPSWDRIHMDVSGDAVRIKADAQLLGDVLINLYLNAAQAMNGEGTITVQSRRVGDTARLSVADVGPGVPESVRDKAFDPFFTTKARGTGLGLAISRRAVELHGGAISMDCPPSGGTVFTVTLPTDDPHPRSGRR